MQKEVSNFDFSDFYDEGFEKTSNIRQAIYVFQDGSMWNGYSEGGGGYIRDVDHGSIEAFFKDTSIDRYHPEYHSMVLSELVQVVPETQTVLTLETNNYSEEQLEMLQKFEQEGFSIEKLESSISEEQEKYVPIQTAEGMSEVFERETKEPLPELEEKVKQASIELEENIMELDDEEFWEDLQSRYDLTKLEDIEKAQEETEQRLLEEDEEAKELAEIENEMWEAYEQQQEENIYLQEELGIAATEQKMAQHEMEQGLSF
ncbi:hypothetical protein [Enterococcus faecalis]|uniref:hypothetical protein n=1 Tax=Enterococcus faecalis TaxID=1351 RepID=UPI000352D2E5|nr:hypothetical protein [Enterococcus faecalis]EPH97898.1 hypothetical protein D921_00661 [Enterococcus faecalis F01966]